MDLILACHVKNNDWYKLINYNLSKIINYCNSIYIVYSIPDNINSELFEKNILYKNVNFIKVENYGYDFNKYKIGLLSLNVTSNSDWNVYLNRYSDLKRAFGNDIIAAENHWWKFGKAEGRICQLDTNKSVILMNDSFIISRNIDDIINKIQEKINNEVKFIGLSRCDMIKQHYQSYFWVLNYNLIPIFCDLLTKDRLDTSNGSFNIILKCEVEISNLFINRYKSGFIYSTNQDNLILDKLVKLLNNGYPIIKLKCLKGVKYHSYKVGSMRSALCTECAHGKFSMTSGATSEETCTTCGVFKTSPNKIIDFNPKIYKELHSDLKHLSDKDSSSHFFNSGIFEGRKYKYNQRPYIPQNIKILLNNTGLQYESFLI
ncbi:hypothetical protein N9K75_01360 [bacterium]|nr:hypothetical protein [bacterium]